MNIQVFRASLRTVALAEFCIITAFVRTPSKPDITHMLFTKMTGDILNADSVSDAVKGHELPSAAYLQR